ncbi:MAG: hypothetical protein WCI64_09005 [Chlorobium sp.]
MGITPTNEEPQTPEKKQPQQGKFFHDIVLLFIGFGLTSILGSAIGSWFQQRGWEHQRAIEYNQIELNRATETFEDLSRVLDRRLYRTRLVLWDYKNADTPQTKRDGHNKIYSDILIEWNENVNRNLALTERYFGPDMRSKLESVIMPKFAIINEALRKERRYAVAIEEITDELANDIYFFNIEMLKRIQERRIGLVR